MSKNYLHYMYGSLSVILFDNFIRYLNIYHGNHTVHSNYLKSLLLKADSLYIANALKSYSWEKKALSLKTYLSFKSSIKKI